MLHAWTVVEERMLAGLSQDEAATGRRLLGRMRDNLGSEKL